MPNGERQVVGGQVIIERVGREDGGEYQCWNLRDNNTNISKFVNVLCEYFHQQKASIALRDRNTCYRHVNGHNYTLIKLIFYKEPTNLPPT